LPKIATATFAALFACSGCGPAAGEGNGSNTSSGATTASVPAPKPAAVSSPAPPLLEPGGLGIDGRSLPFGSAKAAAVDALSKALGRPPTAQGANEECGGGGMEYAEWKDEITLWFDRDGFAGWDEKGRLRTKGGIGLGSARADLNGLDGLEVGESSLGTEFSAGDLGGILDSSSPEAKVVHLWGGTTCVFR
jgi:hypothetical protein